MMSKQSMFRKIQINIGFSKSLRLFISVIMIVLLSSVGIEKLRAEITTNSLLECTNSIRQNYGKKDLIINKRLEKAALRKIQDMTDYQYWSHQNPYTKQYAWLMIKKEGYNYSHAAENLAIGFSIGKQICDAWANSPTHFENINNSHYVDVGFASQKVNLGKEKGVLVVQLLGKKKTSKTPINIDLLSASILTENQERTGIFMYILLSIVICKSGIKYLHHLKEDNQEPIPHKS
jgi:hypothetical protein